MDQEKFEQVSMFGLNMIAAVMNDKAIEGRGKRMTYNAYLPINGEDLEVVVLGYQYDASEGHTNTKSIAILMTPELFEHLAVDGEARRSNGEGDWVAPKVREEVDG